MKHGYLGTSFNAADLTSGAVGSGDLAVGAVTSGDIASGQVGSVHLRDGDILTIDVASGAIQSGQVGSGSVPGFFGTTRAIQSGTVGVFDFGSGAVIAGAMGSGSVLSGNVASGQIGRYHFESGTVIDLVACEMALSGIRAVAWGSGGCFVVTAERTSGLRLPSIGVVAGNFVSGDVVPVVRRGMVRSASSGVIASGFFGQFLYVGSGGLIINQSGFMEGASSGQGAAPTPAGSGYSGALVQRIGVAISGGIDVFGEALTSGLISGHLSQF